MRHAGMVVQSKYAGGFRVLNLTEHNKAMLIKNLHKFYNYHDPPRVDLLWSILPEWLVFYYQNNRGSFWWSIAATVRARKRRGWCSVRANGETAHWRFFDACSKAIDQTIVFPMSPKIPE